MDELISRRAAIEEIARRDTTDGTVKVYSGREVCDILNALPTAEQRTATMKLEMDKDWVKKAMEEAELTFIAEPRKGKWIIQSNTYHEYWECDQCGMGVGLDDVRNYCPNCGAKMEESE